MDINIQDIEEVKEDVDRTFKAALHDMDYQLLQTILDGSKKATKAVKHQLFSQVVYYTNIAYWEIGEYINKKIIRYKIIPKDFFGKISDNIARYLNVNQDFGFSPENLKRCYKIVGMLKKETFLNLAKNYSWEQIIYFIDNSDNETEVLNEELGVCHAVCYLDSNLHV
ncbi:MAG: hypothetical protein PVG30_05385 [Gammaproteobacteria bacterium]|jgi:hypothetical protein